MTLVVGGGVAHEDIIYGGSADTITALGSFNDIIYGGAKDDLIYSSSSGAAVVYVVEKVIDTIYNAYGHSADGATAVVTLSGGEGADEFSFRGSTDVSATLTGGVWK